MLVRRCAVDIYIIQNEMVSRYSFRKPITMSQVDRVVAMS